MTGVGVGWEGVMLMAVGGCQLPVRVRRSGQYVTPASGKRVNGCL